MSEGKGLVVGLLGATLVLAGVGAVESLGALGSLGGSGVLTPTTYTIHITMKADQTCEQTVKSSHPLSFPKTTNWAAISLSSSDTVVWEGTGTEQVTVRFPSGTSPLPSTPFYDYSAGAWAYDFVSPAASPPATLTPKESAVNFSRFAYGSVTVGGSTCPLPVGGMGIVVTK